MVKSPRFGNYKNSIVLTFVANTLELFNTHKIEAIAALQTQLQTLQQQMAQSFQIDTGSAKTDDLKELDKKRDDAIRGITQVVSGYALHPTEAKSKAGEALLRSIRKYATNIIRLSYQEETAVINNLIDNWTNDATLATAITTLGLADWQTALDQANQEFDTVYVARSQESAQKQTIKSTSEIRKEVEAQYQLTVQHINANVILNPSDALNQLVAEMNSLIDKYNIETARKNRKTDDNDEEEDLEEIV